MNAIDFNLINEDFFNFVQANRNSDPIKLRLKRHSGVSFDMDLAITQIECRNKVRKKLPEISGLDGFLFPSVLSTEQCTAEPVARLHAEIVGKTGSVLDMTAGLCIDSFYISKNADRLTALEINDTTAEISRHNMARLAGNVEVLHCDSTEYIRNCDRRFDAIFIDPARRADNGMRTFGFTDCKPDLLSLLPDIKAHTPVLYIKASPMLDISQSVKELGYDVSDIWVTSLNNECKELFFKTVFGSNTVNPVIHCINISSNGEQPEFAFTLNDGNAATEYATIPSGYLYEPNASIMKTNSFAAIPEAFPGIKKIAPNSHLFTADNLIDNFPGRMFKISGVHRLKDPLLKAALKGISQANVSVRNFPVTAEQLKKRLKLRDGGDIYIFGTTLLSGDTCLLLCQKIG